MDNHGNPLIIAGENTFYSVDVKDRQIIAEKETSDYQIVGKGTLNIGDENHFYATPTEAEQSIQEVITAHEKSVADEIAKRTPAEVEESRHKVWLVYNYDYKYVRVKRIYANLQMKVTNIVEGYLVR